MKAMVPFSSTTYELSVFFRQEPTPGWLRCRSQMKLLEDGIFDMDTEIFDSSGQLVAQAKQMCVGKYKPT